MRASLRGCRLPTWRPSFHSRNRTSCTQTCAVCCKKNYHWKVVYRAGLWFSQKTRQQACRRLWSRVCHSQHTDASCYAWCLLCWSVRRLAMRSQYYQLGFDNECSNCVHFPWQSDNDSGRRTKLQATAGVISVLQSLIIVLKLPSPFSGVIAKWNESTATWQVSGFFALARQAFWGFVTWTLRLLHFLAITRGQLRLGREWSDGVMITDGYCLACCCCNYNRMTLQIAVSACSRMHLLDGRLNSAACRRL